MRTLFPVCMVCLVACGRIGFGASTAGGRDASAETSAPNIDAADAATCTPFDIYVPSDLSQTSLTWTGDHYVLWMWKANALGFVAISETGTFGSFNLFVTNTDGKSLSNGNTIASGDGALATVWANSTGDVQVELFDDAFTSIVPPNALAMSDDSTPYVA